MTTQIKPARPGSSLIRTPLPAGVLHGRGSGNASLAAQTSTTDLSTPSLLEEARKTGSRVRDVIAARLTAARPERENLRATLGRRFGLPLSYAPVNEQTFELAFAGCMGGLLGGRQPTSVSTSAYVSYALSALAWATEFDTLSDNDAPLSIVAANLIFGESYAVWEGRGGATLVSSQLAPLVTAVLTSIVVAEAEILLAGITPALYQSQTYVTGRSNASTLLGAGFTSVLGGAATIVSHGGNFVVTFTGTPTWSSGQANTNIEYQVLIDGGQSGPAPNIVNPVGSTGGYSSAVAWSNVYSFPAGSHTIDVQALTGATPNDASSAGNQLIVTEYNA
jgi:hypothetical protein